MDKTILDRLADPLTHLVRNSLDHGLEPSEERLLKGKPEAGLLQVEAFHQGGGLIVEVTDDGRGLDREGLARRARALGLQAVGASDAELMFLPGVSTASQVSEISGRGVGMDVVLRNVTEVGGTVEVHSEPGRGCRFRLQLPLTLAIIEALLARVGPELFAVPVRTVVEAQPLKDGWEHRLGGSTPMYRFGERFIPALRLDRLLGVQSEEEPERRIIVVTTTSHGPVGLVVDELVGYQRLVVKSLARHYRRVRGILGTTVRGDGRVVLILDPAGLHSLALGKTDLVEAG